jgi:large subunit ribosomal protein L25
MDLQIALDAREAHGKANRRLRRQGIVPGVVYGKGEGSTSVQVEAKALETLYRAAGRTSIVQLQVPGDGVTKTGIIKSLQRHPLSGAPLHVDFFVVDLKAEMEVEVPLVFVGEAPAVEETGGTLLQNLNNLRIKALPTEIPHEIVVNVSTLTSLDVAIHVRDLSLNRDAVQVLTDPDEMVAKVMPPRIEEEPEVELEAEEIEGEVEEGAEEGEGEGAISEGRETPSGDRESEEGSG